MKLFLVLMAVLAPAPPEPKEPRCSAVALPPGFVGPELPPCPSEAMLRDLEMLQMLDVLENWELLGE